MMMTLLPLLLSLLFCTFIDSYYENCSYVDRNRVSKPPIYWINLERSPERGIKMQATVDNSKFESIRVTGVDASRGEIYLPPDIEKTWPGAWCIKDLPVIDENNPPNGTKVVMTGLCGRARKGPKGNTLGELGCTVSHLLAIRKAVDDDHPSGLALIAEDDIVFPFDIDYPALAASAPQDYQILQLFNSNPSSMKEGWRRFTKNSQNLWIESHPNKKIDFWSTCIYMINIKRIRPVIDALAVYDETIAATPRRLNMKVLAGITSPCVPFGCCNGSIFNYTAPCVYAPRGYQADSFIYAAAKTYMLTVPIITAGKSGNESTMHQEHVNQFHNGAFGMQREFIGEMLSGKVQLPHFVTKACNATFERQET